MITNHFLSIDSSPKSKGFLIWTCIDRFDYIMLVYSNIQDLREMGDEMWKDMSILINYLSEQETVEDNDEFLVIFCIFCQKHIYGLEIHCYHCFFIIYLGRCALSMVSLNCSMEDDSWCSLYCFSQIAIITLKSFDTSSSDVWFDTHLDVFNKKSHLNTFVSYWVIYVSFLTLERTSFSKFRI